MIRELPTDERPRERLLKRGGSVLTDRELIAVLLRTGRPGSSVLRLAEDLLEERGGLAGLLDSGLADLKRNGLGPAKAASLLAAVEIGRRLSSTQLDRQRMRRPEEVARHVRLTYSRRDQEVMGAFFTDTRGRLISERELYRGTLARALVEPREVLKQAFLCGASGVILFHTHPSGDPTPSLEDVEFTRHLDGACEAVGMVLMDHVIVGHVGKWISLKDRGLITGRRRDDYDDEDEDEDVCEAGRKERSA